MNPILQMLNRNQTSNISALMQMAKGNPEGMFKQMMQSNPQFRSFVDANKGKPADQIAREHGIDPGMLRQFMK